MDIATAFDSMNHEVVVKALQSSGMKTDMILSLMAELSGCTARISIPGAGSSDDFPLERGGKQGGVETPDLFNILMEQIVSPLVSSWNGRGFGVFLDAGTPGITHALWADNIFLLAASVDQFRIMSQELTTAIYEHTLAWKECSLQMLCPGDTEMDVLVYTKDGASLQFKQVAEMSVLGIMLDRVGSSRLSLDHRLLRGEANFWAQSRKLCGPASFAAKMKAWHAGPSTSALHGASTWLAPQWTLAVIDEGMGVQMASKSFTATSTTR